MIMETLCLTLLAFAAQYGGYETPEKCPEIEQVSKSTLQEYVCPERNCPVAGLYIYGEKRLLLDETQNVETLYPRSIFIHELVHYLQDLNRETEVKTCHAQLLREKVAFYVQEQYLRANYFRADLRHNLDMYRCSDDDQATEKADS